MGIDVTSAELWTVVSFITAGSAMAGLGVTVLLRRMLPSIPFFRTWLFYTVLLGFLVGVVLWVGLA